MNYIHHYRRALITVGMLLPHMLVASTSAATTNSFPDNVLDSWQEKSFVGNTSYTLIEERGVTVLRASADKTASVLYKEEVIDLTLTPWLEWSWKIDSTYTNLAEKTREGDDFPARIYVTAQIGFLPWDTIAINYVWSSAEPLYAVWASPFTEKSKMMAVQSGQRLAGRWVNQRRNIKTDFKQLFNIDVNQINGYAVMVDGDNALQTGTAYFGNIDFLAN